MEKNDTISKTLEHTDHELMLSEVYNDDVELLYIDCCLSELLKTEDGNL